MRIFRFVNYLRTSALAVSAMSLSAGLISCEHKELCYDHSHMVELDVRFDWSQAPEANPESMSVYFFPKDGGKPLRYEITSYNQGYIKVPAGSYNILSYNSDTHNIQKLNTDDYYEFELTSYETEMLQGLSIVGLSLKTAPRVPGSETKRVVENPEMIWSDAIEDVDMTDKNIRHTLTLNPQPIIDEVSLVISDIKNIKNVGAMSATIYDMAGGYHPGRRIASSEPVIIPFELSIDKGTATAQGSFHTFGHCSQELGEHHIYIYAVMNDGGKWYFDYDLTSDIHKADDGSSSWDIKIQSLELPKPVDGSGGINPSVSEWKDMRVILDM